MGRVLWSLLRAAVIAPIAYYLFYMVAGPFIYGPLIVLDLAGKVVAWLASIPLWFFETSLYLADYASSPYFFDKSLWTLIPGVIVLIAIFIVAFLWLYGSPSKQKRQVNNPPPEPHP